MTKEDFAKFAMFMKTVYPKDNVMPNEAAMEIWFRMMKHLPIEPVMAALQKWVVANKWPPTIADIIQGVDDITQRKLPSWEEGWKEVCKAIMKYGLSSEEEAIDSMSQITRKCVTNLGWRNLCLSENAIADRANFRNCYEIIAKREAEDRMLPPALKETISKLTGGKDNAALPERKSDPKEKLAADGQEQVRALVSGAVKSVQGV